MNRLTFLKKAVGATLLPATTFAASTPSLATEAQRVRQELLDAWRVSERTTLITAGQMPIESFNFRYTPEAMSYGEQWRHCCQFTVSQLTGRLGVADPYEAHKLPDVMTKAQVMTELKAMYAFVRQTIESVPDAKLFESEEYLGSTIPIWRLLYVLENHIIHHRGQCMVYLRLQGIAPEGYLGW